MRRLLDNRRLRALRPGTSLVPNAAGGRAGAYEVRFTPARWLVVLLGIAGTVLTGGKLGIAGLVWSVAPRPFKVAAVGAAVAAAIVVAGALAAIVLLAMQLS